MDLVKRVEAIETVNRKIFAILARMEGRLSDVVQRMATKDDLASLSGKMDQRFDAVAGQLDDIRFRLAVHADTLLSHDRRLNKLEARKSS